MSATRKPQVLKGFRDYLPEHMLLRQQVLGIIRDVFEKHGFEPLDTPALEYMEILTGKAGENEKLMYHFADQGEREVGLRYDLTVPLARVVAMHQNDFVLPFKRYHMAPVWRAEKPQRGRFREFWQCDADIVGPSSSLADAEAISVLTDALHAIGLSQAVVVINHRKLLSALAEMAGVSSDQAPMVYRSIDKLDKIGRDGVHADLTKNGVASDAADNILDIVTTKGSNDELLDMAATRLADYPNGVEAVQELRDLIDTIELLGVPKHAYRIDLALARGIDYYTGPVYEAVVEEPKVGSVAGGGRYDGLVGTFLGRDIPATGISLGIERILEVIQEFDLLPIRKSVADVFMVYVPDTLADASAIARELRSQGIRVDQSVLTNKGIGAQLKYADRRGIPFAVILGPDELARDEVSVKDLASGEQKTVERNLLPQELEVLLHP
ncbi:MAG TPA: histidine--tRNA ligase [Thermomicrobiales bacterium]|nr:histidine--tRNA ligase [Thermomicrobiales bacterium]